MQYLAVKNFEHFQHYHDRAPSWIKLYNALLDDYAFMALPEAARAQLMLLWLLASRYENRIPRDERFLRQKLLVRGRLYLGVLLEAGFLVAQPDEVARDVLGQPEPISSPHARGRARAERRAEREKETETEKDSSSSPDPAPVFHGDVENPEMSTGAERFFASLEEPKRTRWRQRAAAWLKGVDVPPGRAPTAAMLSAALGEYVDAHPSGNPTPAHVWGFVEQVMRRYTESPERAPPARQRRTTGEERTFANGVRVLERELSA